VILTVLFAFAPDLFDFFLNDLAGLPNFNLYTLFAALLTALYDLLNFLNALLVLPPAF